MILIVPPPDRRSMASRKADLALVNGRVFRGLGEGVAGAVAVADGRIVAVGSDDAVAGLIGPATRVIDLAGRLAAPGLCDAHLHLLPVGLGMAEVDVRPRHVRTLEGLLKKIRERAAASPPGEWIVARGYDQSRLDVRRHVAGQELAWACRDLALEQFGLLAPHVLAHWGVTRTEDIGRIVFTLVEVGLLVTQPGDQEADFAGVYDFGQAFGDSYEWRGVRGM
jgi:uncharacterized repeat protein (TIGR04138 family)